MQRKRKKRRASPLLRLGLLLLAVVIIVGGFWCYFYMVDRYERSVYPLPYHEIVARMSERYELPPEIVYGVMYTESGFNPQAVSPVGAAGLMQITEDTFLWLQSKTGETIPWEEIFNEEVNIRYGCLFLHMLHEEFGSWETAFAAYNAGRTRVKRWLRDSSISEDGVLINIPFRETADYVLRVTRADENYKRLYFS